MLQCLVCKYIVNVFFSCFNLTFSVIETIETFYSCYYQGEDIFKNLKEAAKHGGIKLRIAQSQPSETQPNKDTEELQREGIFMSFTNICMEKAWNFSVLKNE